MNNIYITLLFTAPLLLTGCQQSPAQSKGPEGTRALVLDAKAIAGREVFLKHSRPACSQCHTLRHAGAEARIGSNLDELKPDVEKVRQAVTYGLGLMPPQSDKLTAEQIDAVAHYVAMVAGN